MVSSTLSASFAGAGLARNSSAIQTVLFGILVCGEVAAQEDACPSPAGVALDEITRDRIGVDDVEALFEMIEPPTADGRIGKKAVLLVSCHGRSGAPTLKEVFVDAGLRSDRIADTVRLYLLAGGCALREVLEADLVLEVVLVEQCALQEAEVSAGSTRQASIASLNRAV